MCDYSLMAVPNRLAREGEELVAHRFPTGSLGLASPSDLKRAVDPNPANLGERGTPANWQNIQSRRTL